MKKVYLPTMEELEQLQKLDSNVYSYLVAKAIEVLVMDDVLYEETDMFERAHEEFREFPEILYSIGNLYPERIKESFDASNNIELCLSLLKNIPSQDRSVYHLDVLENFNQDKEKGPLFNQQIISNTARILSDKLPLCPRYRFDYKEPNILLDDIFSCELPKKSILSTSIDDFGAIDPIYILKLNEIDLNIKDKESHKILFLLARNMLRYSKRYGLEPQIGIEYESQDILSKPNDKVKKLIRCLEEHKKNQ